MPPPVRSIQTANDTLASTQSVARAVPVQTYYVSAKVRMSVRFEEYGQQTKTDKPPTKSTLRAKGTSDPRSGLKVIEDPGAPTGIKRFVVVSSAANPGAASGVSGTKDAGSGTQTLDGLIPMTASWKQNSVKEADQLTLKFKYTDFPMDPRAIRSVSVEFYLGTVKPEDHARGMRGENRDASFDRGEEPLNVIPDNWVDDNGKMRTNLRFEGWADKIKISLPEDGQATVEMECRDNTCLLIKEKRPPQFFMDTEIPIDEAVAKYLTLFKQCQGLSVEYRPIGVRDDKTPPRLKQASKGVYPPNLGPPAAKDGGGSDAGSVLDYLIDCVGSLGHSLRVEGTRIIIQQAQSLLDGLSQQRQDDPYVARVTEEGRWPIRAMLWGQNIQTLDVTRDYARNEAKNVEVRCYDPIRKNLLVARYPLKEGRVESKPPGEGKSDNAWIVRRVSGIRDQATLNNIAREVFENQNRRELEVAVKTKNLASFGGGNSDPDLLDLRPGDDLQIELDANPDSTIGGIEQTLRNEEKRDALINAGFSTKFAAAYIKSYTDGGFQRIFKVREVSADWGDEGISFDLSAVNFIEARVEKGKKLPEALVAAKPRKVAPKPAAVLPTSSNSVSTSGPVSSQEQISSQEPNSSSSSGP